jgi:hypothetical protein
MPSISERETRSNAFSLQAPFVGRDDPENSFKVQCYRIWSVIPKDLCKNQSTSIFKVNVEKMLSKRYLYAKY